jgi:phage terminase large subunit
MANDIARLAHGLGFKASRNRQTIMCNGRACPSIRVFIGGDVDRVPVQIERKRRGLENARKNKDWRRTRIDVKPIGDGEYFGFELDGDHLFMLADGTVTHNTRTFAKLTAVRGMIFGKAGISGQILCGRQFQNSLSDSSLEEIKRAIQDEPWLMDYYEIGETYVRSRDGRIEYTFAGLERNIDSIKSKGRILLCWVDEAEGVSDNAWSVLIPTLREEGDGWHAELWVTWNPKRKGSATDKRFRQTKDPRIKVAELNWRDNPKFPAVLERQRQRDLAKRPDTYDWIWEGAYATVVAGAYYAKSLTAAKAAGRISRVAPDPLMRLRAFTDIGGTGKKADSYVWWVAQFIGREVRVLDHYEAQGQPLEAHLLWAQKKGYGPDRMDIWLPHDGVTHDKVFDVSYESALNRAGYTVEVVPNQGPGAAIARIEAARRVFPSVWFNADTTEAGRDALGMYHEKRDEARDVGLGPEHDWSSHSADAFGMLCIVAEDTMRGTSPQGALVRRRRTGMAS